MAKNTSNWNWRNLINLLAYVAIFCIGVALLVGKIGVGSIAGAFRTVAEILAYTVTAISAFYFAVSRRHWAYYLIWIICVVLIVVLMVI
ncbi:MAG: hypothetical protein ACI4PF_05990 [Christensenellales bacterium]